MTMKLVVKGHPEIEIVATKEVVWGKCYIEPDADDPRGWSYICAGTDIDWDSQRTEEKDGHKIFLDEDGEEYLENQIELIEVGND